MYYEKRIAELEAEIAALRDASNVSGDTYFEFKVGCSENNSGGSFWLRRADYNSLTEAGFITIPDNRGFYKIVKARNEDEALGMVKGDFWEATNRDPDSEGCNCCGEPFYFEALNMTSDDNTFYWEAPDTSGFPSLRAFRD